MPLGPGDALRVQLRPTGRIETALIIILHGKYFFLNSFSILKTCQACSVLLIARCLKCSSSSRSLGDLMPLVDAQGAQIKQASSNAVLLLHWDDLEPWQQDNEYILRHYRPCSNCYRKSIASLGYLHNQTVNVYSHLLGALIFSVVAFGLDDYFSARYGPTDRILIACFFIGVILCLGSSSYFHLLQNHSPQVYNSWLTMDFFGIICLIVGTALPLAYYSYPCHPTLLWLCWLSVLSPLETACPFGYLPCADSNR